MSVTGLSTFLHGIFYSTWHRHQIQGTTIPSINSLQHLFHFKTEHSHLVSVVNIN